MKRLIIAVLAAALLTGGCAGILPRPRSITQQAIVTVLGIDKEQQGIRLTALVQSSAGEGEDGQKSMILSAEQPTAAQAVQKMQSFLDKSLFLGHIDYYLIGEQAAKEDMSQFLDFFLREFALRLNSSALLVHGTAYQCMEQAAKHSADLPKRLMSMEEDAKNSSLSFKVSLLELFSQLNRGDAFVMPVLSIGAAASQQSSQSDSTRSDDSGDEQVSVVLSNDLALERFAVVNGGRMAALLPKEQSLAVTILSKKFERAIDRQPQAVLRVSGASLRRHFEYEMGQLRCITLALRVRARIDELIEPSATNAQLEKSLCLSLEQGLRLAVSHSLGLDMDYLGLKRYAHIKNPFAQIGKISLDMVEIRVQATL